MDNTNDNSTENRAGELVALNERILQAEEASRKADLDPLLHKDFAIIRASGVKQGRQKFLNDVESNSNLGRSAEPPEALLQKDYKKRSIISPIT